MTEFARRKLRRAVGYGWAGLLGDCSGGVIAALIALPYGLAMASLMGLPPVLGVFTSILTAPIIGGSPMSDAIASPYGNAIKAAMMPPEQSPKN